MFIYTYSGDTRCRCYNRLHLQVQSLLADPWSQLVVADLPRGGEAGDKLESGTPSAELAKHIEILDEKLASGEVEEDSVIEEFKHLPPPTMDYTKFRLQAGYKEVKVPLVST